MSQPKIVQPSYTITNQPMFCGSSEAEQRIYTRHDDKSGRTWLVANQPNSADNIYVSGGKNSDGFAGRTLTFHLTNGDTISLQGPWHTNADSLFKATGLDIRDKYQTFVVVGLSRTSDEKHRTVLENILYIDKEPQISAYDRGKQIAKSFAQQLKTTVYYYQQGQGGSSCGPVLYKKED